MTQIKKYNYQAYATGIYHSSIEIEATSQKEADAIISGKINDDYYEIYYDIVQPDNFKNDGDETIDIYNDSDQLIEWSKYHYDKEKQQYDTN